MQTVILCGGMGTRAYPATRTIPKALMQVQGAAILDHVLQIYALYGHTEFILSCGYLKEAIIEHVQARRYPHLQIECVDTGEKTDTAGRIRQVAPMLGDTFFATYCDGLGNVDIAALLDFHRANVERGALATVTSVPLVSQYGVLSLNGDLQVKGFQEKPVLPYWINGGFFVFEKEVFNHWEGTNLEGDVLPRLAQDGRLYTWQHRGFWKSMDTLKDQQAMNAVWPPVLERMIDEHAAAGHLILEQATGQARAA